MPETARPMRRLSLLLLLLLVAGCKNATPQGEKPWVFACPEAESRVAWDDGRSLVFAGPDPADPAICLARPAAGGAPLRLVWGMVEQTATEGSGHRAGMAPLFPAKTGANGRYTAVVSLPGSGVQYRFDTGWRVVGFEPVEVPAGKYPAVVFERRTQGTGANAAQSFTIRYWVEGVSGVVLKRTVELGRGGSTLLRPFQAKELRLPPPPPRQPPPPGAPEGPPSS